MATKEAVWEAVQSMASVWRFPGEDLKATALAYHLALRDLSDNQLAASAAELLSSWEKQAPPKPADFCRVAKELRPPLPSSPRLPPREPSHEEIMHRVKCQTYHLQAIAEVLGDKRRHDHSRNWSPEEWKAISKRQAELKADLGLT